MPRGTAKTRNAPQAEATPINTAKISLLDAAEALFADREFDAVTTRHIAERAAVNLALVHYYFGTKQALFRAVLARRIEEVSRRRLRLLDDYDRRKAIPIADIVDAFVRPLLELATTGDGGWRNYIRLNGRVASSDKYIELAGDLFDPAAARFVDEIARTLRSASRREIEWGYLFMVSAMSCAFAGGGRIAKLSGGRTSSSDFAEACDVLVPFITAGLAAAGGGYGIQHATQPSIARAT